MSSTIEPSVPEEVPAAQEVKVGYLTRKAGLNAASYLIDFTARTVVMLVVTPIILAGLGKTLFGAWQVLLKAITYLASADGRPTQALKWVIVKEQTNDDHEEKRRAIGSAIGVALVFLPFLLLAGSLLVYFSPRLTGVGPEHATAVRIAAGLLVMNFALSGLFTLPESILEGMNLRYRRMIARSVITTLAGAGSAYVAYLGFGLTGLAVVHIAQSLLLAFLAWTITRKLLPWFSFVKPTWSGTRSFMKLSLGYLGSSMVGKLMMSSDVVMLGALASAEIVADYALTAYATGVLIYTVPATLNSAVPGMGRLLRGGDHEKIMALRSEMMTIAWLILTVAGTVVLVWNRSFVNIWVGSEHYAGIYENLLIVLMTVQFVFIQSDSGIVDSTQRVRRKTVIGLVSVITSVVLSLILVPRFGIVGLCTAYIAGRSIVSVGYPLLVQHNLELKRGLDWKSILRPGLAMVAMFAGAAALGQQMNVVQIPVWIAGVLVTGLIVLPLAFYLGLNYEYRSRVQGRLLRLMKKTA